MNPGLVVKLRPLGPWRLGPDSGARNRVDFIYHSDALYSAMCGAFARLGDLDAWLEATARNPGGAAVQLSSLYPFQEALGFIVPPRTLWPPPMASPKVRWKSARFVPLGLIPALLAGQVPDEEHWAVDGTTECLVPLGHPGPFRTSVRWNAAVDRMHGSGERHSTACLEFREGAGLWGVISFSDEAARLRWSGPVRTALRLLADSGFGGERSRGWGRAEDPEFIEGVLPQMILAEGTPAQDPPAEAPAAPQAGAEPAPDLPAPVEAASEQTPENATAAVDETAAGPPSGETDPPGPEPVPASPAPETARAEAHWLLSLFVPGPQDTVDWDRGNYHLVTRGGRIESPVRSGELKKLVRMVAEGSVLVAASAPRGIAPDVAPEGFAHPVYRAGFALAIPLPEKMSA